jgi:hypothetical protein
MEAPNDSNADKIARLLQRLRVDAGVRGTFPARSRPAHGWG